MNDTPKLRPSNTLALSSGISLIMLGVLLNLLARPFDGFVQGLLQGAGITVLLIGVYVMSPLVRRRAGDDTAADTWLPSRDGDR